MLTIIIPCYNREELIGGTLRSLECLGAGIAEVIVVDDGSTDRSVEVTELELARLADLGIAGRVVRNRRGGACAARNTGLALAKGDYVLFLDSDDSVEASGVLALHSQLASSPQTDIAYGWVWVIGVSGKREGRKGIPLQNCRNRIFDQLWHTSGAIYRKALLAKSGPWDTCLSLGDDWEFAARARVYAREIACSDCCVGAYIQHDGGRLSTRAYDRAKCRSVIRAAIKIKRCARRAGSLDIALRKRVYRRLLVQATELSINSGRFPAAHITRVCTWQKADALSRAVAILVRLVPLDSVRRWVYARLRAKSIR